MKRFSFIIFLFLFAFAGNAQKISIIPEPVSIAVKEGVFELPAQITVGAPNAAEAATSIRFLKEKFERATARKISVNTGAASVIDLVINKAVDASIGNEGYMLSVKPGKIIIRANSSAGLFYGAQTLVQLFPKEIESGKPVSGINWTAPAVEITDYPRVGWRGLMFDVARHFFTKEEVKQFIHQMARYKYNLLHLHLSDDEGWRLQIKTLPKLTEVGAWNVKRVGYFGDFIPPTDNEPRDYGGFYTHEDIRELVAYALEHHVNILPEIDVPGHSLATIASYPDLSCTPGAEKYNVRSGEKIINWQGGGKFTALIDNTLCPANEKVYEFLDKVVTEVAQLFPFEYIHMGGDEAPKNFWEKSPQVKALMQREKLKDMHEVQSYFTKRVQKIVASKGKKMIGWDEILEGGLAPGAAVMSWRGISGGIEAAKMGHDVVMSPTTFAYIDYMQGDASMEPRVYASLRLNKSYEFDPIPQGVDPKFIKGGQANLWTEQIYNMRHAQYMVWPRGFAIAESVWSPKEKKNWKNFTRKVEDHFERYDIAQIKYAPSMFEPIVTAKKVDGNRLQISLATEVDGLSIHYSFDNSFPDQYYPVYQAPLVAPIDAFRIRVVTYRGDKQMGRMMTIPIEDLKKRAGIN